MAGPSLGFTYINGPLVGITHFMGPCSHAPCTQLSALSHTTCQRNQTEGNTKKKMAGQDSRRLYSKGLVFVVCWKTCQWSVSGRLLHAICAASRWQLCCNHHGVKEEKCLQRHTTATVWTATVLHARHDRSKMFSNSLNTPTGPQCLLTKVLWAG